MNGIDPHADDTLQALSDVEDEAVHRVLGGGEVAIRALRLRYGLSASRLGCRPLVDSHLGGNTCSNGHQKENRRGAPADHLGTIGALA